MSEDTLQPLSANIRLLGGILGETIARFEGRRLFRRIERLRRLAQKARLGSKTAHGAIEREFQSLSPADKYKVARAFSEFLRLANLAEQAHRIRRRKAYARAGEKPQPASPHDTLTCLKAARVSARRVEEALRDVRIDLVLTAHPTEAMLPQSIRTYRFLSECLLRLDSAELTPLERDLVLRDVRSAVVQLWLAGTVRGRKPTPVEEARYGLELAERILWRAVPQFHHQLSAAYRSVVGDMSDLFPQPVRFGSWMGGDRDGHPGVTAAVTRRVLLETSRAAVARYLAALAELRRMLIFDRDARGRKFHATCHRLIGTMEKKLRDFRRDLPRGTARFTRVEFLGLLADLQQFLARHDAAELAKTPLQELIWRVRVFGLCFLKLDLRQSADRHLAALDELFDGRYAKLDEKGRVRTLRAALRRPPKLKRRRHSKRTAEVLRTLKLYDTLPTEFLGPYIISMASSVSDMLGVLVLLRAAGVKAPVRICPLFETPDSLDRAVAIMEGTYRLPEYRARAGRLQQVMVGYSDSAKRSGYLNSAWEIYRLQTDLLALGKKHGMDTTFFHGRGGAIARGGGPIETALLALPRPHPSKRLRVTEQGESLNAKFGLPEVAERTMELYLSGFLRALLSRPQRRPQAWSKTMDRLAHTSAATYRRVVYGEPDFMAHYRQLTPSAELSLLKIGSRPGRRGGDPGLEAMRAIPWVFGWTQSRTLLPAWLGIADALDAEIAAGGLKTLQDMYARWPFFQAVMDLVEMVVAKSDAQVTEYYSRLLVEPRLQWLTLDYVARLARTKRLLLKVMRRKYLLEKLPVLARSIRIRSPYVDVLNILQAHLLREYRSQARPSGELMKTLAVTISGISAGMRNTG